ncbi:MAG: hypothetical protein DWQ05_04365 [Calditrichaeota bacterium]|nr:MAG: hypothetical protein DWQ05_04365 [Calditrichota bacterium]
MEYPQKLWYSELIKLDGPTNYCLTNKSHLRSVQSLIAEPHAQIHQLYNRAKGPLPPAKEFKTESNDLAIYFSGIHPCEEYCAMPIGIILRVDGFYVSRALTWKHENSKAFFANMTITSSFFAGAHTVSFEALNKNSEFDNASRFNLTIIEL